MLTLAEEIPHYGIFKTGHRNGSIRELSYGRPIRAAERLVTKLTLRRNDVGVGLPPVNRPSGQDEPCPLKVLVLIPTLSVGGAEMDLVRILPRLDRKRFKITVCTLLERGALAHKLIDNEIEVVGPFPEPPHRLRCLRLLLRQLARPPWTLASRLLPIKFEEHLQTVALRLLSASLSLFPPNALKLTLRLLSLPASLIPGLSNHLRPIQPICDFIRAADIDVVHAILPNAYAIGAVASCMAGWRPVVMSRVSLNWYHETHRLLRIIECDALHRMVNGAIGNSAAILHELRAEGIPGQKLHLIYNGIDTASFKTEMIDRKRARDRLCISENSLVFSSVAALHAYKGHFDLLDALHRLNIRLSLDWVVLIVGRDIDGNLARLTRLAADLDLARHVRLLGERNDIPKILSAADIHISASHHEGFPNNILEAMCAGLPVVATAVGGVPELIVHEHTGLLVPPRNPKLMADALYQLANHCDQRSAMGTAGHARVASHFAIDRSVAAFQEIYSQIALTGSPPPEFNP